MEFCADADPRGRIGTFLETGDGAMHMGPRRFPLAELMDAVSDSLESAGFNAIRIREPPPGGLASSLPGMLRGNDAVVLYDVNDFPFWESELPGVLPEGTALYYGQDLCHQVTVCVKRVF